MLTVKDAFHNYYDTPRLGTRAPAAAPFDKWGCCSSPPTAVRGAEGAGAGAGEAKRSRREHSTAGSSFGKSHSVLSQLVPGRIGCLPLP
jgi:hypothetical protein